jgi:hypothetical protein
MRGIMKLMQGFASKKLGIAETTKIIQEKIMNVTQIVNPPLFRTTSKSSEL